MSLPVDHDTPPEARRSSGGTVAAWIVILVLTLLVVGSHQARPRQEAEGGRLDHGGLSFQARYLVGAADVLGGRAAESLERQVEAWHPPARWQQVRVAVVAGELIGPEAALERLRAIEESPTPDAPDDEPADHPPARDVLLRLYEGYADGEGAAPSVSESERAKLPERLGWFGSLALAPPGSDTPLREQAISVARRTFYLVAGAITAIGIAGLAGFVLLVVFLTRLFNGTLSGLEPSPDRSGVYAEGFACWLALFVGLSIVGGLVFGGAAVGFASLLPMVGSLAALGWPRLRGVSWEQLREDLGWTTGRGPGRELAAGAGGYAMAIPLLLVAAALTGIAVSLAAYGAEYGGTAGHPAAEQLVAGTWWQRLQILLLAVVVAPVVEEIAFRGLLYRHLRDATGRMRRWGSVLSSALLSSVLFAVLHPQGMLAVPALTAIALAMAFIREWRGTLVPAMVAHGLNNAVVMAVLLIMLAE